MPKQINTYTFGQALVRKFGLKGRFQPVLDEVIVPVVLVGETVPESTRLAVGGILGVTSGAGNQNIIFLRNPLGTNILLTVKSWWAVSGAPLTDFLEIVPGTTTTQTGTRQIWRDRRIAGLTQGRFTRSASAALVLGTPQYHLDADAIVWVADWILHPGDTVSWRQNAQNTTLDLFVNWEETDITATVGA